MYVAVLTQQVRVAQLDRASGYGPEGREFESSPARQKNRVVSSDTALFLFMYDVLLQPFLPCLSKNSCKMLHNML